MEKDLMHWVHAFAGRRVLLVGDLILDRYLFGSGVTEFEAGELDEIARQIDSEMQEIFYGRNFSG